MASAEEVRFHVDKKYIRPAREQDKAVVQVPVKEVAEALAYESRFPMICTALRSDIFATEFRVRLARTEGPDQSSTTVLIFNVLP